MVILLVQSFKAVAFVADIAFRQDIVGIVFLRVGGGARSRVAFVAAHVFRFVPLAARQHQQTFGVFMEAGGCRRYAVAAVAAAVAVFQTEMPAFARIDEIARRERDHVHHAAERIAAVERGIRAFDNIDLLERVAFDHITSRNRTVGAAACIRFGNAYAVHHHQNAVAVYAPDINARMATAVVVRRHADAGFIHHNIVQILRRGLIQGFASDNRHIRRSFIQGLRISVGRDNHRLYFCLSHRHLSRI